MMMYGMPNGAALVLSIPAVLWAITFHEYCHGYVAYRLGDPTPEASGRLTLNPLAHLDIFGTLMLLLFRFGWAKPVPIDPRHFKRPGRDIILVSLAGAAGNILTAVICGLAVRLFPTLFWANLALARFIVIMMLMNLGLAVFNLLPVPPLDGSRILMVLLPPRALRYYFWLERYGFVILMLLIFMGVVQSIIGPVISAIMMLIL